MWIERGTSRYLCPTAIARYETIEQVSYYYAGRITCAKNGWIVRYTYAHIYIYISQTHRENVHSPASFSLPFGRVRKFDVLTSDGPSRRLQLLELTRGVVHTLHHVNELQGDRFDYTPRYLGICLRYFCDWSRGEWRDVRALHRVICVRASSINSLYTAQIFIYCRFGWVWSVKIRVVDNNLLSLLIFFNWQTNAQLRYFDTCSKESVTVASDFSQDTEDTGAW